MDNLLQLQKMFESGREYARYWKSEDALETQSDEALATAAMGEFQNLVIDLEIDDVEVWENAAIAAFKRGFEFFSVLT